MMKIVSIIFLGLFFVFLPHVSSQPAQLKEDLILERLSQEDIEILQEVFYELSDNEKVALHGLSGRFQYGDNCIEMGALCINSKLFWAIFVFAWNILGIVFLAKCALPWFERRNALKEE